MRFIYPAIIRKTEEGKFRAFFPDLACCQAEGETLEEAVDNANDAARDWITLELSEEEPELPHVTDIADMELSEGDEVRNIAVNVRFYEGWDE